MGREALTVSFLLIVLLQFHTGSYHLLSASETKITEDMQSLHLSEIKDKQSDSSDTVSLNSLVPEVVDAGSSNVDVPSKMSSQDLIFFENKLLKLLGMSRRPSPMRDKVKIPSYFMELYNNQVKADLPTPNLNLPGKLTRSANTIRSFYHTGTEAELFGLDDHLRFDMNSIPEYEQITGAELQVPFFLDISHGMALLKNTSFQILVHDIVKVLKPSRMLQSEHLQQPVISYPVDSKPLVLPVNSSEFWVTFDVFPAVQRIFQHQLTFSRKNQQKTVGLALEFAQRIAKANNNAVSGESKIVRVKKRSSHSGSSMDGPTLLTYSDDGKNLQKSWNAKTLSRHYRSAQNYRRRRNHHRYKNRRRNMCSKKKMFVDFTDVGWNDWIVAPPGYQAFYCSGECPFPMAEHLNATNHAVIQALVNSMNPRLVPPPCCVPNKYSSLSLLYTDSSDRIVLKNYNEMIVDSCGCS